jgi:hypothetical protein
MQITHEEACQLIQFDADQGLKTHQKNLLASHLEVCSQCRNYADSIQKIESALVPMLHRAWDRQPIPLSVGVLTAKEKRTSERLVMATRIAALAVVFLAFFFGAWNSTVSSGRTPTPFLQSVPMIPTPSTFTMTARTETKDSCSLYTHVVEKNDTLAAIAYQYAVRVEDIIAANAMQDNTVITGAVLMIPVCQSTPTTIAHTTTFTPVLPSITITPGGY